MLVVALTNSFLSFFASFFVFSFKLDSTNAIVTEYGTVHRNEHVTTFEIISKKIFYFHLLYFV